MAFTYNGIIYRWNLKELKEERKSDPRSKAEKNISMDSMSVFL